MARAMEKELVAAVTDEPPAKVVVDMGKLEFLSSVGYMPFISLRKRVRSNGGKIVLCQLSEVVKEIFESTRLLINPQSPKSMFDFADTLEDAVAMFE